MQLIVDQDLKDWLASKKRDIITVDVLVSRGGGCCGGCAFIETIINYGEPKENKDRYLLFKENGLEVYIAGVLKKKTDQLNLYLKGLLFKRPAIKGYETECSL